MIYMGSKSKIAKDIVPIIQSYIDDNNCKIYIEPFTGGANIIDKIECDTKIGSDLNKYLIALLNRVKNNGSLYESVSKELYDKAKFALRNNTNEFEDWQIGNIGFLASYNGRWFDGGYSRTGYAKTKNGSRLRNYYQEAKNNLLKQAVNGGFKKCIFKCCDYTKYLNLNLKNCVIYCDPPYQNTKQYSNAINFDYDKFWQWCRNMSKNNIVIVSELKAPEDFVCIWQKETIRSINANDKNKKIIEKLFIYKG